MTGVEQIKKLKNILMKRIVGQEDLIDAVIITFITNGHVLLEGPPGVAKTETVRKLADCLYEKNSRRKEHHSFKPLQSVRFIPDMQPTDLIGGIRPQLPENDETQQKFKLVKHHGPIFTHLLIADEINRAPSKVQAALLQVMQEREVDLIEFDETIKVNPQKLFSVFATQNPIEEEGTYPLSAAFLDRFLFKVIVNLPSPEALKIIAEKSAKNDEDEKWLDSISEIPLFSLERDISTDLSINKQAEILLQKPKELIDQVKSVMVPRYIENYVSDIVTATYGRPARSEGHIFGRLSHSDIYDYIEFGASPRSLQSLVEAAKGRAYMDGRQYVIPSDVQRVAFNVFNHRLRLSFEALSLRDSKLSLERYIVDEILNNVSFREN